jgi:Protein of unknown function (DUF3592)
MRQASEEQFPEVENPVVIPSNVFLLEPGHAKIWIGRQGYTVALASGNTPILFLVLITLLSSLAFAQGISEYFTYRNLAASSAITQGEVIARRRDAMTGRTLAAKYFVSYRFTVPDGNVPYTREQLVEKSTFDRLVEGSRVNIRYLPAEPTLSTLVGSEQESAFNSTAYIMSILGLLGMLIAAIFLRPQLAQLWREKQLWRKGRLLNGHVLSCRRYVTAASTSLSPNDYGSALKGNFFVELSYCFRSPGGKDIRAIARHRRNDLRQCRLPGFGTPVVVLYRNDDHYAVL